MLRHKPESEQGWFYRGSERVFNAHHRLLRTTLRWVLRHQIATLVVAVVTLGDTVWLYIIVPKGFFPVQDTGVILGISEAPQTISFAAMAERQQALAQVILQDPAVESLSSFIGIDGTNTTVNSGRIQINLKPLEERQIQRQRDHPPPAAGTGKVEGITLFMQPVQDLTVEDRVSRTQYQYSLEDPDPQELSLLGAAALCSKLQDAAAAPRRRQRRPEPGLQTRLVIDRDTASASASRQQMIDDTLYDAFGQRQISTMFTQSNQYRVVLEVKPEFQERFAAPVSALSRGGQVPPSTTNGQALSRAARHASSISAAGGQVPLSALTRVETSTAPLAINHQGQFPVGDDLVQSRARHLAGGGRAGHRRGQAGARPAAEHSMRAFKARRKPSRPRLTNEPHPHSGGPGDGLHRPGGAL